jgi:hypothetical protein
MVDYAQWLTALLRHVCLPNVISRAQLAGKVILFSLTKNQKKMQEI